MGALLCIQLTACTSWIQSGTPISQAELAAQIETGTPPVILDVRSHWEFEKGHIPGAININFLALEKRIDEIKAPRNAPIVVYCEHGIRANVAEDILKKAGFTSVLHLEGDISAWRANKRPLERPQKPPQKQASQPESAASTESVIIQSNMSQNPLPLDFGQRWVVTAAEAKALVERGATLLDARNLQPWTPRIKGAQAVRWQSFSPNDAVTRGRLLNQDQVLTQKLQALGISSDRPVVVFADPPQGWGEDGRMVWMLRSLGHSQAVMVDGGYKALKQVNASGASETSKSPGNFVVNRKFDWDIQRNQLKTIFAAGDDASDTLNPDTVNPDTVMIDTREPREFRGETPYGEQRGGHLPGAINLYFKDFITEQGKILPQEQISHKLQQHGITPQTPLIVYCTGGIRSGWLASVLVTAGYSVKNYAGSMWEWSAGSSKDFPLIAQAQ